MGECGQTSGEHLDFHIWVSRDWLGRGPWHLSSGTSSQVSHGKGPEPTRRGRRTRWRTEGPGTQKDMSPAVGPGVEATGEAMTTML